MTNLGKRTQLNAFHTLPASKRKVDLNSFDDLLKDLEGQEKSTQVSNIIDDTGTTTTEQVTEGNTNNIHVHLRGGNSSMTHNLHIDEVYKKYIIDNGADTTVIGKGWTVIGESTRKANVIGKGTYQL